MATKSSTKESSIPTSCVLGQEITQPETNIQAKKMNEPTLPSFAHGIPCLNDICGENLDISISDLSSNQEVDIFQT